jgi:hypothetical protein
MTTKIWTIITNIAVVASLLGVGAVTFLTDPIKQWIALAIFVVALVYYGYQMYRFVQGSLTRRYPEGFLPLSAFVRYVTSDGYNITYEIFRHIQIKRPYLSNFDHPFNWTGSHEPKCESDLQYICKISSVVGKTTKLLQLKFKKPRIYNDVEIIHFRMELDDSDHKSQTYVGQNVHDPIRLVCFRVELLHANQAYYNKVAVVSRKRVDNGTNSLDEILVRVKFDQATKSYYHQVTDPEPGYNYRLTWERP